MFPTTEKSLSDGIDVAGTAKCYLAKAASVGNLVALSFHHLRESLSLVIGVSPKYNSISFLTVSLSPSSSWSMTLLLSSSSKLEPNKVSNADLFFGGGICWGFLPHSCLLQLCSLLPFEIKCNTVCWKESQFSETWIKGSSNEWHIFPILLNCRYLRLPTWQDFPLCMALEQVRSCRISFGCISGDLSVGGNRSCDIRLSTKKNSSLLIRLEHLLQFIQKNPLIIFQIKVMFPTVCDFWIWQRRNDWPSLF